MKRLLDNIRLELLFLLFVIFVFCVGGFDSFTLLNCVPIILSYLAIRYIPWRRKSLKRIMLVFGFSIFSTGLTIFVYLAWTFDFFAMATGSSTSGLIFLFLPAYSIVFGLFGALIGWVVGLIIT